MKKLFQAIRRGDLAVVKDLLAKDPTLLSCTAKQPPKKDDGQSPLQVALKTSHLDIALYLLDMNADVDFMEAADCCNEWRAPVLHDGINAAIMNSRWNVYSEVLYGGLKIFHTQAEADKAYQILARMVAMGADVNGCDSYGNSCLQRACLQARQILPSYDHRTQTISTDRVVTAELASDLQRIFALLYDHGARRDYIKPGERLTVGELYKDEPVAQFLLPDEKDKKG